MSQVLRKFDHNGRSYEVRLIPHGDEWAVRVYDAATNSPHNGYIYLVDCTPDPTTQESAGYPVNLAVQDVLDDRWKCLVKALHSPNA